MDGADNAERTYLIRIQYNVCYFGTERNSNTNQRRFSFSVQADWPPLEIPIYNYYITKNIHNYTMMLSSPSCEPEIIATWRISDTFKQSYYLSIGWTLIKYRIINCHSTLARESLKLSYQWPILQSEFSPLSERRIWFQYNHICNQIIMVHSNKVPTSKVLWNKLNYSTFATLVSSIWFQIIKGLMIK